MSNFKLKWRTSKKSKNSNTSLIPTDAYGGLPKDLRKGELSPQMRKILRDGIIAASVGILCVAAFAATTFVGGTPFAVTVIVNALFAGSLVYLVGIAYGIVNDLLAVRNNLPYFILGHVPEQRGLIKSNKPNVVAVAWGILATMGLSLMTGFLFAIPTLIMVATGVPFASFILPILVAAIPLALIAAHIFSRRAEKNRERIIFNNFTSSDWEESFFTNLGDTYQESRLRYWLKDDIKKPEQKDCDPTTSSTLIPKKINQWLGNSDRNGFGYLFMPLIAVGGLVSLITCSVLGISLGGTVGAAFSTFAPVGVGIALAVGIAIACVYLYRNQDKQIDNGYRLDYDNPKLS